MELESGCLLNTPSLIPLRLQAAECMEASMASYLDDEDPTADVFCQRMAAELEETLLRALEMGVQRAASIFDKTADAEVIHRGQFVTESEAAKFSSLASWSLSFHVGFHSNSQIISHLLHLIVQMALFPRPEKADAKLQIGSRSAFTTDHGAQVGSDGQPRSKGVQHPSRTYQVPGWRPIVDGSATKPKGGPRGWRRSIQERFGPVGSWSTSEEPGHSATRQGGLFISRRGNFQCPHEPLMVTTAEDAQQSKRSPTVRIGGGWHVLREEPENQLAERTPSPSCSPARSRSPDPEKHPFAHGAPSQDTPIERYAFGAYATGMSYGNTVASKDPAKLAREVSRGKLRHYGFYRVLKPREPVVPAITNGSLPPSPRSEPLEELPGSMTIFAPDAIQIPSPRPSPRPRAARARPSSARYTRDFERRSIPEPGRAVGLAWEDLGPADCGFNGPAQLRRGSTLGSETDGVPGRGADSLTRAEREAAMEMELEQDEEVEPTTPEELKKLQKRLEERSTREREEQLEAQREAMEEEEEFTDVDFAEALMLLGGITFIMMLFYLVNDPDQDMRYYSWSESGAFSDVPEHKGKEDLEEIEHRIECRTKCWATIFAHMTGFASIHCGTVLQHFPGIADSPAASFVAAPIMFLWCVGLNWCARRLRERAKRARGPGEAKYKYQQVPQVPVDQVDAGKWEEWTNELWNEYVIDAEHDSAGLSVSFMVVQACRYTFSGHLPEEFKPASQGVLHTSDYETKLTSFSLVFVLLTVVLVVVKAKAFKGPPPPPGTVVSFLRRCLLLLQISLAMAFAWTLLFSARWEISRQTYVGPSTALASRMVLALGISFFAAVMTRILDCIADLDATGDKADEALGHIISSLGILVGVEVLAARTSSPQLAQVGLAVAVVLLILPAWRRHILSKVITLETLGAEERREPELEKDEEKEAAPQAPVVAADGSEKMRAALQALKQRRADLDAAHQELGASKKKEEELQKQLRSVRAELDAERTSKASATDQLQSALKMLKSDLQAAELAKASLASEAEILRSQEKERQQELEKLRQAASESAAKVTHLGAQLQRAQQEKASTNEEAENLKRQTVAAKTELEACRRKELQLASELQLLKTEKLEILQKAKADAAENAEKLRLSRSELEELRGVQAAYESQVDALRSELLAAKVGLGKAEGLRDAAVQEVEERPGDTTPQPDSGEFNRAMRSQLNSLRDARAQARRWGPSAEVKADVEAQRRSARRSGGRAGRAGRSGEVRSFDSERMPAEKKDKKDTKRAKKEKIEKKGKKEKKRNGQNGDESDVLKKQTSPPEESSSDELPAPILRASGRSNVQCGRCEDKVPQRLGQLRGGNGRSGGGSIMHFFLVSFQPGAAFDASSFSRMKPSRLFVVSPNGQQQCGGEYVILSETANGHPVWEQRAGNFWLYSGANGMWIIGGREAKDKAFKCSHGQIFCRTSHGGVPPDQVKGVWERLHGEHFLEDSALVVMAATKVRLPPALRVVAPNGQQRSAGDYARPPTTRGAVPKEVLGSIKDWC
eukprot:g11543.t1